MRFVHDVILAWCAKLKFKKKKQDVVQLLSRKTTVAWRTSRDVLEPSRLLTIPLKTEFRLLLDASILIQSTLFELLLWF